MTMKTFLNFFKTDRVPRWQIVVFGLVVMCAGWAQNEHYYQKTLRDAQETAEQQRLETKILEIQRQSVDFQTYAGAFVSSVLDSSGDQNERRAVLLSNILAQDAAVDVSSAIFSVETGQTVQQYRAALREMRNAVDQVEDVISMGLFWKAASDLLVARNAMLNALEKQAHSPST